MVFIFIKWYDWVVMKKNKKKVNVNFGLIFILLLTISAIVFCVMLYSKLPTLYLFALLFIFLLIILLLRILVTRRNRQVRQIGIVLIAIMLVIVNFGNYYLYRTNAVLDTIGGANVDIIEYSLVVNNDSSYETAQDLSSDTIFEIMTLGDTEFNDQAVASLNEDLGFEAEVSEMNSLNDAYTSLLDDPNEVLILNEGLRSMFIEAGHDLDSTTKVIGKYSFERPREETVSTVDVTNEPFIVYISGIDIYGSISLVSRSDVNKLMVVNPNTKNILLIDIPRDYYIPQTCQYNELDKLTHTGIFGVDCTVESVSNYFGIDIDYYARVNFSSLIKIVDALGGIEVNSAYNFCSGSYCYSEGINYLNGDEALMFSRERYSLPNGDSDRIENQSRVLKGIIDKVTSPAIITNYMDIMGVLSECVETNMPSSDIDKLIQMQLSDMAHWNIESLAVGGTGATEYSPANGFNSYVMWPDEDSVNEAKDRIYTIMAQE